MTGLIKWVATGLVMACAFVSAAGAQMGTMDMNKVPGILPSGFGDAVDRDIAKIREATVKFKASAAAEAAGYKRADLCIEHQPAGGMGYHFDNDALRDATLDVEHPEVMVYEKKPDGTFQLNGVEFIVPTSAWTSAEPPRIMGQALKKAERLGIWYLHVWTWKASPTGLFADWNPDVKCADSTAKNH